MNEFNRVIGTYRAGAASIDVRRESSNLILKNDNVWQLSEHTFRSQGGGGFTSVRNPEFSVRFGGERDHARTLALTLHGRAFGDATYSDSRK